MKLKLRPEVKYIIFTLQQAGFEAYLVGGAVRDLILAQLHQENSARKLIDYDFATNATPQEIQHLFPDSYYQNQFGTVGITHQELVAQMGLRPDEIQLPAALEKPIQIDLSQISKLHPSLQPPQLEFDDKSHSWLPDFEITTYRSDEIYHDFRRPDPDKLVWGKTINQDLARRDFRINAIALTIENEKQQLIDPYDGQGDLVSGFIQTVGDPNERLREDALRMMRAIRLAVQLNMQISDQAFEAIIKHHNLISQISWERISDEFLKILATNYPAEGIKLLGDAGLLEYILPELLTAQGVKQGGHHTTDVWTHSLDALAECANPDPIVRLAVLLHDIGKPATFEIKNDEITFYNHEIVGSRMVDKIAQRLKLTNDDRKRLFTLVRYHMFYYQPEQNDAAIRRFMRQVGLENLDDILDLREADRLGSGAKKTSWRLEEMKQRMTEQLHQPLETNDLAIDGHDLMTEFNQTPGPWIGEVQQKLLQLVIDQPELNQKEILLGKAREILKTS